MLEKKLITLLQRLHKRTEQGAIPWEGTVSPGRFQAAVGDLRVEIQATPDRDYPDSPDIDVVIRKNLVELERFSNSTLRDADVDAYGLMKELYTMARRQALGVDQAIDSLLDDLGP